MRLIDHERAILTEEYARVGIADAIYSHEAREFRIWLNAAQDQDLPFMTAPYERREKVASELPLPTFARAKSRHCPGICRFIPCSEAAAGDGRDREAEFAT